MFQIIKGHLFLFLWTMYFVIFAVLYVLDKISVSLSEALTDIYLVVSIPLLWISSIFKKPLEALGLIENTQSFFIGGPMPTTIGFIFIYFVGLIIFVGANVLWKRLGV